MLFVSANWSFSDGTLAATTAAPYAGVWLQAVHRAAVRAGFRSDGSYRPVDGLHVVLAGDTFDCLTSATWTGSLRPWHDGRPAHVARSTTLFRAARRGRRLLVGLSRWARGGLPVPTADRRGRPTLAVTTHVPVRVALLVGDRDAWLEEACGPAAGHGLSIGHVWSDDGTTVRHGSECDPCLVPGESQRMSGRGWQPTLGESVAVDLVARFAAGIMATSAASVCRQLLAALAACGPLELPTVLGLWLESPPGSTLVTEEHREATITQWRRSVAAWHRETVRQPPVSPDGIAVCDALAGHFDAVGGGRAAAPGRDVCDLLAPRPAAAAGDATVLGHAPASCSRDRGAPRLICLGRSAAPGWNSRVVPVGSRLAGPPPTVGRRGCEWERLPIPGIEADRPLMPSTLAPVTIIDAA